MASPDRASPDRASPDRASPDRTSPDRASPDRASQTTPPLTGPTTPPPGSAGRSATVALHSWTGGFIATVRVTAGAGPIDGWAVTLTLPAGAAVTNAWNARNSGTTGAVRFANVSYNGRIAAGASTEFGFQGTGPTATPACAA